MYRYQSFRFLALLLLLSGSCLLHATQVVGVPPSNNKAWIRQTESIFKALKRYPEKVEFVRKTFEQVIRHQQVEKLQALLDSEKIVKEIPTTKERGLAVCCSIAKEHKVIAVTIAAAFVTCGANDQVGDMVAFIMSLHGDASCVAPAVNCLLANGANPFSYTAHEFQIRPPALLLAVETGNEHLVRSYLNNYPQKARGKEVKDVCKNALKATIRNNRDIDLALPFFEKGIYYPKLLHDIAEYFPLRVLQSFLPTLPHHIQQALLTERKKERESSAAMQRKAENTLVAYVLRFGYLGEIADFKKKATYLIKFIVSKRLVDKRFTHLTQECSTRTNPVGIEDYDVSRKNSLLTHALCPIVENRDIKMLKFILSHARSMIYLNQVYEISVSNIPTYRSSAQLYGTVDNRSRIRYGNMICEISSHYRICKENVLLRAVKQGGPKIVRILLKHGAADELPPLGKKLGQAVIHCALAQLNSWDTVANQSPINRDLEKLVAGYIREESGLLVKLDCASDIARFCGQTPFILSVIETLCAHTPAEYLKDLDYRYYVKQLEKEKKNDTLEGLHRIFKAFGFGGSMNIVHK